MRAGSSLLVLSFTASLTALACATPDAEPAADADPPTDTGSSVRVERLLDAPIIGPALDPSIGENIQGPSLIRVPDWVPDPLGRYYLYFADHKGHYIRLAYADDLLGPWSIHVPGSLQIEDSHFLVEPPEVTPEMVAEWEERRGLKLSHDIQKEITATHIASPDVHVDDENQRIVSIDLSGDWMDWTESEPVEVLRPERDWEGANAPLEPSVRSTAYGHVNQVRDPAIYEEDGRVFLLYAVAGESGIAIAEVFLE